LNTPMQDLLLKLDLRFHLDLLPLSELNYLKKYLLC
jgi:hypothetical protein